MLAARDIDGFARLAALRLLPEPPGALERLSNPNGDHALDRASLSGKPRPKLAAVLVPIVAHADGLTVILTRRGTNLRSHSGQISLPGGKVDPADPSPLAAALREAEEEIGLARAHVRPLGYLDAYLSSSNFLVLPAVAAVEPGFVLELNAWEVEEAFEVPLGFLMDEANHELHVREWQGALRQYFAMPFGRHYIWGVTAGILRNLYERLSGP